MKVKELKKKLESYNEDCDVVIEDCEDAILNIVEVYGKSFMQGGAFIKYCIVISAIGKW